MKKNNIPKIEKVLKKDKCLAMLAPSFVTDFSYPNIIWRLKKLGFDKVVELTFGAKMVNREYHKQLQTSKKMLISSACPGVVNLVKTQFPKFEKNLVKANSPMIAMGKICKKHYPKHKVFFISPCDFKKIEAQKSKNVDYVIDFNQLQELFKKYKIKKPFFKKKTLFDRFYNDYTKIYPLSGGLAKTANLKGILKCNQIATIDGAKELIKFLKKPNKNTKFVDCLFCEGGCIGGPHTNKKTTIKQKHKAVCKYLGQSKKQDIPENRKGLIKKAKGLRFKD